ncbi:MAG: arylsulfatase [Spirochaetes bacterium]|nr:arylsulfatase [Spirochaetota bacterium]
MDRRQFLRYTAAAAGSLAVTQLFGDTAARQKPNIIVMLADDMGFSDLGCFGSEIETPHLDGLAANGVRFTQFYNCARCCPSRAAILTGLYPHLAGVGHMTEKGDTPGYLGHLNDRCVTIAEVLKPAGYETIMTGKWHVGQNQGVTPKLRGFDRSLNSAAGGFYYPSGKKSTLYRNGEEIPAGSKDIPADWYSTDLWVDQGLSFVDEARTSGKPFFWYLAHNAPHFPLQAPAKDIAKYRGKYKTRGWDKLREDRYKKQKALGIINERWPLSPRPDEVKAWETLSEEEKDRFDHIMAIYAAVVDHLDQSVGRLIAGLKARGIFENTLIMFVSDNGGNAESGPNGKLLGTNPGAVNSTVFCGQSWATLENTPFRRYKHYDHEGGISSPFIAHWPNGIAARGELRSDAGHFIDILPTCAAAAGAVYPTERAGNAVYPPEGISLLPAFAGTKQTPRRIFWEHEGNAAVRDGDWKLVRLGEKGPWELYNLKDDRTELVNLAEKEGARAKELSAAWDAWALRVNVTPRTGHSADDDSENEDKKTADKKSTKKKKKTTGTP